MYVEIKNIEQIHKMYINKEQSQITSIFSGYETYINKSITKTYQIIMYIIVDQ